MLNVVAIRRRRKSELIALVPVTALMMVRRKGTGVYAYMMCCGPTFIGRVSHSCMHGPRPHRIRVHILRADNDPATYAYLRNIGHVSRKAAKRAAKKKKSGEVA